MKDAAFFEARTDRQGPCWLWLLFVDPYGYGRCKDEGRMDGAHRVAYRTYIGSIPPGLLHVLHHCDTPHCCNPGHLFLGTNLDNIADRTAKGRSARGERHWGVKLTASEASEIICSSDPQVALAERYGVARQTVSDIKTGRLWAYLRDGVR